METSENTFLSGCPNGWTYFSGTHSCYKFMTSSMSWNDARSACLDLNADLPSITNEATNSFLTSLTTSLCWTGGFLDFDNKWKWTDGSTWGYTNWCGGQPDGTGKYLIFNCAWLGPVGIGKWDDGGSAPSYICQLRIQDKVIKITIENEQYILNPSKFPSVSYLSKSGEALSIMEMKTIPGSIQSKIFIKCNLVFKITVLTWENPIQETLLKESRV